MNDFKFIYAGKKYSTREEHVCAPIFRKRFSAVKGQKVTLKISAVGFYRLFLNGQDITKGYFAPYISNPDDYVYYDEYDLSDKTEEENVLCVMLGNGFSNANDGNCWQFENASFRCAPRLAFALYAGGEVIAKSDESVEVYPSPVTFDDLRAGERYDARFECPEVFTLHCSLAHKYAVAAPTPKGELRKSKAHCVKSFGRISPVAVYRTQEGYVYDFGLVDAGLCKLKIKAKAGQRLDLYYGEIFNRGKFEIKSVMNHLTPEDYAQHDVYVCKEGYQEYMPFFTYHGFRYVLVKGLKEEQATEQLLEFYPIHSDVKNRGYFRCSDKTINQIQECTLRSDLGNLVCIPTDCPQREKNGWTADASLSAEQFLYNFDCGSDLEEWLNNVRKAQNEKGALPGIVPTAGWGFEWGNGPAWDSVLIELPYRLYRFYGNKQVITDNLKAIERYFDYLASRFNGDGLLAIGLGDWCETGTLGEGDYSTPLEVTDTLVTIILLNKTLSLLEVVPDYGMREKLIGMRAALSKAFTEKWVKNDRVVCGKQTAQALALHAGIFAENEGAAQSALVSLVREAGGHFKVGVIGARYLFDELSRAGDSELAYQSIVHKEFPSYAYWLEKGATTLWEAFNKLKEEEGVFEREDGGRMLSLNHHFWGSVSGWFYKALGGLKLLSHDLVEIDPQYISSLSFCECGFESAAGKIEVRWERRGTKITLRVENRGFRGSVMANGKKEPLKEGVNEYLWENKE